MPTDDRKIKVEKKPFKSYTPVKTRIFALHGHERQRQNTITVGHLGRMQGIET